MFLRFYALDSSGEKTDLDVNRLAAEFAASIPDKSISPAKLQGYFMQFTDLPLEAASHVGELLVGM